MVSGEQVESPRGQAVLRGIFSICIQHGWILMRVPSTLLRKAINDWRPELLVLVLDEALQIQTQDVNGIHVVSAGTDLTDQGWPSVVADDWEIGRQAARHFLDRGLRSLAAYGYWDVSGASKYQWAGNRAKGFADFARTAGASVVLFSEEPDSRDRPAHSDPSPVSQWVERLPKPVGILAGCDYWGNHLAVLCQGRSLRVPEDVAIVGVDDERSICETTHPPLSSVAIPWEQIGQTAARLAGDLLAGRTIAPKSILMPPVGVTIRRSSDTLVADDQDVAAVLALIHAHACRQLSVAQILRCVPSGQRRLERRFKQIVGRRIVEEIRRVHVEQAKRLLSESDMSMPMVAHRSGFANATKLGKAFLRETGITPTRFRRRYRVEL